jgi:hypothetical protein
MADKARDLQFRVLSDLSKLDLDAGAKQFDELGDASRRALDEVDDSTDTAARSLRDLADDSRDPARKVKRAFDDIGDSSKQTFRRDVDDDLHKAGQSFDEFKDEAKANVSEVASSFRGDLASSIDLVQGTLGGLAGSLGGIGGVVAAAAGAAGVGLIAKAFETAQQKAEELREATTQWTQALIDGTAESLIQQNLNTAATEDGGKALRDWTKRAEEAGIVTEDYVRAMAGDAEARDRILPLLQRQDATLTALSRTTKGLTEDQLRQSIAIGDALDPLNAANTAIREGTKNANALREATNRPFTVQLLTKIQRPSAKELDAIREDVRNRIGVIPVQLRVEGQSKYANTSNNSRYRY